MTKYCRHGPDFDSACYYGLFKKAGAKTKDLPELVYGFYERNKKPYSGIGCDRCGKPDEGYDLLDGVWNAVTENTGESFLCVACVELRFGNSLAKKHFTDAPINFGIFGFDCRNYLRNKKKVAKAA